MSLEGKQFSHYRILQLIGRGGMGEVYLAEDVQILRQVAVKVIRLETVQPDDEAIAPVLRQFLREATTIARLDHPTILPLYDYGETMIDGAHVAYLIIPYRPEGSLVTWLRKLTQRQQTRQLTLKQVVHVIQQASQVLQYAHDHQVMHLDVKPANFLIRSRSGADEYPDLLLSYFGIARLASATSSASQHARGTPTYMAPEQWAGKPVFASDQYALAIMAYELLAGSPPFQGTPLNVMFAHVQEQPKPAHDLNPRLSPAVDLVLQRALAKKPEERFPSVAAFAQAFQEAFQGVPEESTLRVLETPVQIPPAANDVASSLLNSQPVQPLLPAQEMSPLPPPQPKRSRSPFVVVVLILLSLMLLGGVSVGLYGAATGKWPGQGAQNRALEKVAVPSYFDPGSLWTQMESGASTTGLAIMNPNSGPGTSKDQRYADQVTHTEAKGIIVVGYISTSYAGTHNTTRTLAAAEQDVDTYYRWYPDIEGIFVDEVSIDCSSRNSYYKPLYDYIKNKGGVAKVVLNPGTDPAECYMSAGDMIVNFDDSYAAYVNWTPTSWVSKYAASRFWQMIYGTSRADMPHAVAFSKNRNAGWVYVTDDGGDNPYDTLPSYWSNELSLVSQS